MPDRRPLLRPVSLPDHGSVDPLRRTMLLAEVLSAYLPSLRSVRTNDLALMVTSARIAPRNRIVVERDQLRTARRLGVIVQRCLAILPTDKRCLVQSLVTLRMLERRSIASVLVIGAKTEGGFGAHAWLEHDGLPVLPAGDFERLVAL